MASSRMDSDSSGREDSTETDHSMEKPPSVEDSGSPHDASLSKILNLFASIFDRDISDLEAQIRRLEELTDSMEKIHRNTTIISLTGGVIGAVGGITTILGLILTPFTMGGSLTVTGLGIGVATAGGLTGAGSNITDMVHQRSSRKDIEETLKAIQDKLSPIIECVKDLELRLGEIQRFENSDLPTNIVQAGIGIGRGLGFAAESVRIIKFIQVGKVAARASTAVKVAGAITGVFSGLFILLDIVFIVEDAKELSEIAKQQKDGNETSGTVKFIQEMRKACDHLNQAVEELRKLRESIQSEAQHSDPKFAGPEFGTTSLFSELL